MKKIITSIICLVLSVALYSQSAIKIPTDIKIDSAEFVLAKHDADSFYHYVPHINIPSLPEKSLQAKSVNTNITPDHNSYLNSLSLSNIPTSYSVDRSKDVGEIPIHSGIVNGDTLTASAKD